ncbi:hypothetical protein Tco_1163784 [Tanacetum coccineum]
MTCMQQLKQNPEDILDPATAMYMVLILMAKAFKLNYTTPTNNNQIISSNPYNMGQDRQMQMVRGITNQNGNGNVVVARAEGNGNGNNANQIRCYHYRGEEARIQLQAEEFDLMVAAADCEEIKEVNANDIFMANLQQASTSGTHADKSPAYMDPSGGELEQHPATIEETRAFYESLYNNLVTEVKNFSTVNRETKEANAKLIADLARYRGRDFF